MKKVWYMIDIDVNKGIKRAIFFISVGAIILVITSGEVFLFGFDPVKMGTC